MKGLIQYTINVKGTLIDLSEPQVMGILNVTPDSFFSGSRKQTEEEIRMRVMQIVNEGGSMIDIGAYSSRPGAEDVTPREEMERLKRGMKIVREIAPEMPVSVDTFRADVAKMAVEELGADIINDISGGELDKNMFETVAKLSVPYILMHMKGTPQTMQQAPHYDDLMKEILLYFAERIQKLRDLGQKDIILDPGYGFAKTLDHNYELLANQEALKVFELPLLVGVSRKSMIYKLLGNTPNEALNGTTALNTIALQKGANILRVHDVKECVEVVNICKQLNKY
ncbi:MAG: dihydropteroate synthase [Prevotellaceae bacterium]|nr:dihydropteroate synthase [Candidatus Minthosoma caballi]